MNPPSVYDETTPSSHKTSRITKIVQSTVHLQWIRPLHKHALTPRAECGLFVLEIQKKNVATQPRCSIGHRQRGRKIARPEFFFCKIYRRNSLDDPSGSSSHGPQDRIRTEGSRKKCRRVAHRRKWMLLIILILLIIGFGYGGYRVGPGWGYYGGGGISLILTVIVILLLLRVI